MKKIFVAYKFTGENVKELKITIPKICSALKNSGYSTYCTIFDEDQFNNENWSGKKIMQKAFKEIDSSDACLFFVRTPEESKGMLIEMGYSFGKQKKIILAVQKDLEENHFSRHIDEKIEFDTFENLLIKLKNLKI